MTSSPPLTLRVRTTEDLLAMLSGTIGFVPEESLMVALIGDGRMRVSARLDLEGARAPGFCGWLEQFVGRFPGAELLMCAFTEHLDVGRALLRGLMDVVDAPLLDVLVADGTHWWSLLQVVQPVEGRAYDLTTTAMWAELVLSGQEILPSRSEISRRLVGPRAAESLFDEATWMAARARPKAELQDRVSAWLDAPEPLDPREAARLAVLVSDVDVRDIAIAMVDHDCARELCDLWTQVVRQCPDEWAVGPLCVLAIAGWVSGRGVIQVVCMERIETIAPDCSFLDLLEDINATALHPQTWEVAVGQLRGRLPGYRRRRRGARAKRRR